MFCVLMRGGTLIGIGTFAGKACIVMHTRLIPPYEADTELSIGWVDPWVGSGRVEIFQFW